MKNEAGFVQAKASYHPLKVKNFMHGAIYIQKVLTTIILLATISITSLAQEKEVLRSADSLKTVTAIVDSGAQGKKIKKVNVYDPRKAALRSAVLPGWGQIYNKKYWKLPIVYGALGVTAYVFVDNINTYREYRNAYGVRYRAALPPPLRDSTGYDQLKDIYKIIEPGSIRAARDEFRRYIDYSVLFFILFWGLNVVDAAVDAHLKSFDVSPDLSFQFKPGHSVMAGTTGLSFVMHIGKQKNTSLLRSRF